MYRGGALDVAGAGGAGEPGDVDHLVVSAARRILAGRHKVFGDGSATTSCTQDGVTTAKKARAVTNVLDRLTLTQIESITKFEKGPVPGGDEEMAIRVCAEYLIKFAEGR